MLKQPILVLITAPSPEVGKQIAAALVEQKLAACVNIVSPINSLYRWEGKVNDDEEALLIVKTWAEIFTDRLVPAVQAVHPYDVPEVIALPILMGLESYLQWMAEEVDGGEE